ncbi:MAG: hypothetical protein JSW64_13140 [Candidatus Zixiibacteriota bacterium]|nr:MAG: hypothetical protein JSW64_13140 [candidate division Zixibacteria bacterium]
MLRAEKLLLACLLVFSLFLSCGDNGTEPANRPPNTPSNPSPANGALNQPIDVDLSWECSDPDGDALIYGVAMAGYPPDTIMGLNLTQPFFDPGPLNYGTVYGWAVIAMDEHADTSTSQMWTFTTVSGPANNPPAAPSNPSPAHGATDQSTTVQLSWSCSDPDGDDLTYDIYFGTSATPPLVQSNQTATTYNPGTLQPGTTYYWQIIADDGTDQTEGSIWSFSTYSSGVFLVGSYTTTGYANAVIADGNYAYIGDGLEGLVILNISNPSNPTFSGRYNTPSSASHLAKGGNYVYVADYQSGLQIVNVSNPVNPLFAGSLDVGRWNDQLYYLDNYVYLPDRDSSLYIIDVSVASSPYLAGNYSASEECRAAFIIGNYAYVANSFEGLLILNVSNSSNPTFAGLVDLGGQTRGLYVSGDYAYVAAFQAGLKIVNVSNPSSPSVVSTYDSPTDVYDVIVEGNYAYLAAGPGGLSIIDISNPVAPTLVGGYSNTGSVVALAKDENYIYIVDSNLLILEYIP